VFGGKPGRVIEMATEGTIDVAVSDAIVAEGHPFTSRGSAVEPRILDFSVILMF